MDKCSIFLLPRITAREIHVSLSKYIQHRINDSLPFFPHSVARDKQKPLLWKILLALVVTAVGIRHCWRVFVHGTYDSMVHPFFLLGSSFRSKSIGWRNFPTSMIPFMPTVTRDTEGWLDSHSTGSRRCWWKKISVMTSPLYTISTCSNVCQDKVGTLANARHGRFCAAVLSFIFKLLNRILKIWEMFSVIFKFWKIAGFSL